MGRMTTTATEGSGRESAKASECYLFVKSFGFVVHARVVVLIRLVRLRLCLQFGNFRGDLVHLQYEVVRAMMDDGDRGGGGVLAGVVGTEDGVRRRKRMELEVA